MTTILLIRHGQNDFVGKRLAGRTPGVYLNDTGHKQAAQVAEALRCAPIKAVYSSPLERAMQTAAPLAAACGLEVLPHPGLLEVDFGDWQGITFGAMRRKKLWKTVTERPSEMCFPNGETFTAAQQRGVAAIEQIAAAHGEKDVLACFSHSDMIRLVLAHYLAAPLDFFQRIVIDTASISIIHLHTPSRHLRSTAGTVSTSAKGSVHVAAFNHMPVFAWPQPPTRRRKPQAADAAA
jgi:probable phosphoglycerate mutase